MPNKDHRSRWSRIAATATCLLLLTGCVSSPYRYGHPNIDDELAPPLPESQQFVRGKPHKLLDASDWIWPGSLLNKLILWDRDIDSHEISEETVAATKKYLRANNLNDVLVLVNSYRPGSQWSRLFRNREVGFGWRYTLGMLNAISYTIFPGRIFGGDHYNPYTNTISLFSDDIAVSLHEAAHAKDFNRRRFKGFHAAFYNLPGAPLYYEAVASSDALSYLHSECELRDLQHAYRLLHPAYGTYLGSAFISGPALYLAALPGHITGTVTARKAGQDKRELACQFDSGPSRRLTLEEPRPPATVSARIQPCVAE